MKISPLVFSSTTTDGLNHGQYVKAEGGGSVAAKSRRNAEELHAGRPVVSRAQRRSSGDQGPARAGPWRSRRAAFEPTLGPIPSKGGSDGLTRAQAEQAFRLVRAEEACAAGRAGGGDPHGRPGRRSAAGVGSRSRVRKSYRQNCESMRRVHVSPCWTSARSRLSARGCRAAREPHVRSRRVAEDGAQRDDVSALGVRVGGSQGVGCGQSGRGRRAPQAPARRERTPAH